MPRAASPRCRPPCRHRTRPSPLRLPAGCGKPLSKVTPQRRFLLAQLYRQGVGVAREPAMAAAWLRKAAEQDYPHAACELARAYRDGAGVPHNLEEAARWFRRGAEQDCTTAMQGLAAALLARSGASREDRDEAIRWLRKAAELNCAEAQASLGAIYEKQGDIEEALRYYRQAAGRGLAQVQLRLGGLLSDGISTKPDYAEAWVWFKLAAEQGGRFAATQAQRMERKLTAEQLESAKQRLRAAST